MFVADSRFKANVTETHDIANKGPFCCLFLRLFFHLINDEMTDEVHDGLFFFDVEEPSGVAEPDPEGHF